MQFVYYTQYEKQLPTYDEVVAELEMRRDQYVEITEWYHVLAGLIDEQYTEEGLRVDPPISEMFFYNSDRNYKKMQDEVIEALEALGKIEEELIKLKYSM